MPTGSDQTRAVEPAKAESVKLIAPGDFAVAFGLPILAAVSWALPERFWRRFCAAVAPVSVRMLTSDPASTVRKVGEILGRRRVGRTPESIVKDVAGANIEATVQFLRDYRPGGWKPAMQLVGREHVEAALERGSGAILWIGNFAYRDLVPKMAFHRAGYAVSHLSHPRHGFSKTRFAMRTLNRIPANRGDRYLRERVLLSLQGPVGAMRALSRRLRENGVVSITVGGVARHPVMVPFMDGRIRMATGAPDLARATKAALLPVFPVRNEAGLLTVEVAPPLEVPDASTRSEATAAVLRQYAELLEAQVLKHPGQWMGWFSL